MLETTESTGCSYVVAVLLHDDAAHAIVRVLDRDAALLQVNGDRVLLACARERLPHLARPETRVAELLDQRRHVLAPKPRIVRIALPSEKFLIRCAAHSERISDPGIPQTFSVYERKNAS